MASFVDNEGFVLKKEVKCEFNEMNWSQDETKFVCKTCIIDKQEIPSDLNSIISMSTDLTMHNDDLVRGLFIKNCTMESIPKYLGEKFKNILKIKIMNCGLKRISNDDLKMFPSVSYVDLNNNLIEDLPGNLFSGMENMVYFYISHNRLIWIEPEIVDSIGNSIYHIDMTNNPCISETFNISTYSQSDREQSKQIMREVLTMIFSDSKYIREKLKAENEKLSKKLEEVKFEAELLRNDLGEKINIISYLQNQSMQKNIANELLLEDIECFLNNDDLKDFTLILNTEKIKIHKMILAARSSVFAEMIKNNPEAEELKLMDIPAATFNEVLKFVYNSIIPDRTDQFLDIYAVAEKLEMKSLKKAIEAKCNELINDENVFEILTLAVKYKIEHLKEKSLEKVQEIFPDKKFKIDLAEQIEELKKLAEGKRMMNDMIKKLTLVD